MNEVYVTPNADAVDKIRNAFGCFPTKDDLISRQAAIDTLKKEQAHYAHEDGVEIFYEYNHAIEALKNLPPAQPQRKSAYLIDPNPYGKCSNCGQLIDIRDEYNYCPNCGARIEDERDE